VLSSCLLATAEEMIATSNLTPAESAVERDTDRILRPFLDAPDDESARRSLGEILERDASPLAWEVIRGHLRGPAASDLEDVHAGVLLRLAAHLRTLRARGDSEPPIRAFASYVAVIAHNACHAFLRERSPQRARLRTRTRYVLTRDPRLALWEGSGREWLCGPAKRRGGAWDPRSAGRLAEMSRQVAPIAFPDLVPAVLDRLAGPARFDDLVDALAAILGVSDEPASSRPRDEGDDSPHPREVADPAPSAEEALHQRTFLARLWSEIRELPPRQRIALLLNLRDADGRGMIGLFPITEIATVSDLAQTLDMPEARLRELWDELPRDDEWIAAWLGVTRRQVINLRKCARERLARRLRRDGW
jgi:DNA-directed RNA polymerase specialized sigma24 family protein